MQRPAYGQSPPLHHPVPQHVSTVPQLRSPPPLSAQSAHGGGGYTDGSPYQQQQRRSASGPRDQQQQMFGQYTNFMNDPAAQLASQFGQTAFRQGQEYLEQNVNRFISLPALKRYFNVSNSYVVSKLFLVLFPWRHKPWSRRQAGGPGGPGGGGGGGSAVQEGWYLAPRDDINSPDMYIPVMSWVTYVFLQSMLAGLRGRFRPELFGYVATHAIVVCFLEILGLMLGSYLMGISNESNFLDLVAYSGYKFVGIIVTICIAEVANAGKGTGGWVGWTVFIYTFLANSLFLMRSLKYVLLPDSTGDDSRGPMQTTRAKRNQRTQFLFFYSYIVQLFFMWWLSRP